jgi:hypothetical protein
MRVLFETTAKAANAMMQQSDCYTYNNNASPSIFDDSKDDAECEDATRWLSAIASAICE